ncbi:MAG: Mrp/NBP35 family ATP-binding protein [Clostridia bacterium]|nr:Mrp/NBP35 family ATP-binding protein [Clostridia bacterium]
MSECTHDCSSCGKDCSERKESLIESTNENSRVKKVIGVVSGKGGVGKSLVTSLLAAYTAKAGKSTAILDADLTGPSIPKAFGIHERATADEVGLIPVASRGGIKVMSLNLLLEDETDPVVWRGPVIAGTVKQFWTDVNWGDVEYMYVDMPPGTGDVPLTVFQSVPVDGIVIVTSPQELVSMIVEKAVKMAKLMNIPILGLVENMSYFTCPDCGKQHSIYGESHVEELAERFGIPATARLPIDPALAAKVDAGLIEEYETDGLQSLIDSIL